MTQWDLCVTFGLKGLANENLYIDIRYEKGCLKFKRNPYSLRPELTYVWGIQPFDWEGRRFSYQKIDVPNTVKLPIKK